MAISRVQTATAQRTASAVSTSLAFPGNTTPGNLVVVLVSFSHTAAVTSSGFLTVPGNTPWLVSRATNGANFSTEIWAYWATNATTAVGVVYAGGAAVKVTAIAMEYSGVGSIERANIATATSTAGTSLAVGPTGTLADVDDVVIGALAHQTTGVTTPAGYTSLALYATGTTDTGFSAVELFPASTAAITTTWSGFANTAGSLQAAVIAVLRPLAKAISHGFSASDKSALITLPESGSPKRLAGVTGSNTDMGTVRGDVAITGKVYFEFQIQNIKPATPYETGFGISDASLTLDGTTHFGETTRSFVCTFGSFYNTTGGFRYNATNTTQAALAYADGDILGFAVDVPNKLVWVRKNGGTWYGATGTSGDPVAGTNGFNVAGISGDVFIAAMLDSPSTDFPYVRFLASDSELHYAKPSGFSNVAAAGGGADDVAIWEVEDSASLDNRLWQRNQWPSLFETIDQSVVLVDGSGVELFNSSAVHSEDAPWLAVQRRLLPAWDTYFAPGTAPLSDDTANDLVATGITSTPVLDVAAMSQVHALSATGLTSTPTVGSPAIAQVHALTAPGITSTATLGTPVLDAISLTATGITSTPVVGVAHLQGPIFFVGAATAAGTNSAITVSLTALTGGIGTAAQNGDLVVVLSGTGGASDINVGPTTAGYTELADLYANDNTDTNFSVAYKFMTSTPDTSVVCTASTASTNGAVAIAYVFRGVDPTNPVDVTIATATSPNSTVPDAPSVTPLSAGAVVLALGMGAINSGAVTPPSGYTNFVSVAGSGSSGPIFAAAASKMWSGSGAEDPQAFGNISNLVTGSWAAASLVLRPSSNNVPLTATPITSNPVVDTPALTQVHILSAAGITATAALDNPVLSSAGSLNAVGVTSTATVGSPALNVNRNLTATGITSTAVVGTPAVSSGSGVYPVGITSTPVLGTPTLARNFELRVGGPALVVGGKTIAHNSLVADILGQVPKFTTDVVALADRYDDYVNDWTGFIETRQTNDVASGADPTNDWYVNNYYDRAVQYYAWWVATGNSTYKTRADALALFYLQGTGSGGFFDSISLPVGQAYNAMFPGLAVYEQLNGSTAIRTAMAKVADGFCLGYYTGSGSGTAAPDYSATDSDADARTTARVIQILMYAVKMGLTSPAFYGSTNNFATTLTSYVNRVLTFQELTPKTTWRYKKDNSGGSSTGLPGAKTFMVGLLHDQLIDYYRMFADEPTKGRIIRAIRNSCDWLWENLWDGAAGGFLYREYENFNPGNPEPGGPGSAEPGLNLLMTNAYAWLYERGCGQVWKDRFTTIFNAGVVDTGKFYLSLPVGPKIWNETYSYSYKGIVRANPTLSSVLSIGLQSTPVLGTPTLTTGSGANLVANAITSTAVLGTPALTQVHSLTATGVTSTAVLGTPAASVVRNLTATGITSTGVVGTPALSVIVNATATGITSTPTVGSPTLSSGSGIAAVGVTSTAVVGAPVLGQAHQLTASGVSSTPVVGSPAVGQSHTLSAVGLTSTATVGAPALSQAHALTATGVTSTPTVGLPSIGLNGQLVAAPITSTPTVGAPALSQVHNAAPVGVSSTPTVGTPSLVQVVNFTANGLTSTPTVGSPLVAQVHAITAAGVTSTPTVGNPALGVVRNLTATGITSTATIGSGVLSQQHVLAANGITATPVVGAPGTGSGYNLTAVSVSSTPILGTPALSQVHPFAAVPITVGVPTFGPVRVNLRGQGYPAGFLPM